MVGSNGKLPVGIACFVGAIAFAAWAAPSSYAEGELHTALTGTPAEAVVVAALPASHGVAFSRDVGVANGGKPPASAYRRILQRISAARNNWVLMSKTPRLAAMTPIAPEAVPPATKQAMIPAPVLVAVSYSLTPPARP